MQIRNSTAAAELEENYSAQYFWQGKGIPQEGLEDRPFEWTTGRLAGATSMTEKLTTAIERATGFPRILDYNDPHTPLGPFTRWQLYQKLSGNRESASTAFLSPQVVSRNGHGVHGRKLTIRFHTTMPPNIIFPKACYRSRIHAGRQMYKSLRAQEGHY